MLVYKGQYDLKTHLTYLILIVELPGSMSDIAHTLCHCP